MPSGPIWGPEEDERLAALVQIHGTKKWSQIAVEMGSKGSKQCRRRWKNFINLEDRKSGGWTPEEDAQLLEGHRRHGNKWTLIAAEIGGRTDNAVKNRYMALEKKRPHEDDPSEPPHERVVVPRRGDDLCVAMHCAAGLRDQPRQPRCPLPPPPAARALFAEQLPSWTQQAAALDAQQRTMIPGLPFSAAQLQQQLHMQQHHEQGQQQHAAAGLLFQQHSAAMLLPASHVADADAAAAEGFNALGFSCRRPELVINIPGMTATEVPYSQRGRSDALTPGEARLAHELQGIANLPAPRPRSSDDEPLLSTGRHAAHHAMAALTSPSDEPGALNSLFAFLTSATPQGAQHAAHHAAAAHAKPALQQQHADGDQPAQQGQQQALLQHSAGATAPACTAAAPLLLPGAPAAPAQAPPASLGHGAWQMPGTAELSHQLGACGAVAHVHVRAAPPCGYRGVLSCAAGGRAEQCAQYGGAAGDGAARACALQPALSAAMQLGAALAASSPGAPASTSSAAPLGGEPGLAAEAPHKRAPLGVPVVPHAAPATGAAAAAAAVPGQQWGPEELRQLLELLGDQHGAHSMATHGLLLPPLLPGQLLSPGGGGAPPGGPGAGRDTCASSSAEFDGADQASTAHSALGAVHRAQAAAHARTHAHALAPAGACGGSCA